MSKNLNGRQHAVRKRQKNCISSFWTPLHALHLKCLSLSENVPVQLLEQSMGCMHNTVTIYPSHNYKIAH